MISGLLLLIALRDDAFEIVLSLATVGFYISFAFPVFAALASRCAGTWTPGKWNIGEWGLPINAVAAAWLFFQIINIPWPGHPAEPWYVNWGAWLMVLLVAFL